MELKKKNLISICQLNDVDCNNMIKIKKLKNKYTDTNGMIMDIFMVNYSDKPYLKYGDLILDDILNHTTCDRVEKHVNIDIHDIDDLEKEINRFVYKEENVDNSSAYKFLKSIWRKIKLKQLYS